MTQNLTQRSRRLSRQLYLLMIRRMIPIQIIIRRLHHIPKTTKQCTSLLIIALAIVEIPSLLNDMFPTWAHQTRRDWFLWPGIQLQNDYQLVWMLTFSAADVQKLLLAYVAAKLAKQYSIFMFLVCALVFFYFILDTLMLWICFKLWHYVYFDIFITFIVILKGMVKGYKPETIARIKSLF